jgi:hypothetical protein
MSETPQESPAGAPIAEVIDSLRSENERAIARMIDAGRHGQEEGHRFVLLVSTVLALAIPGAAAANLINSDWLRWSAVWFAACLTAKVLSLRLAEYIVGWAVYRRTKFTSSLIAALIQSGNVDDTKLRFWEAFKSFEQWGKSYPLKSTVSGVFSDIVVYGLFLAGVYCLCGGLLDGPARI